MKWRDLLGRGGSSTRDAGLFGMDELVQLLSFQGHQYPFVPAQTLTGRDEVVDRNFIGYVEGVYKRNGIVFACIAARMFLFSEARFQYRWRRNGRPGEMFGDANLRLLEQPWTGGTTGDLLARSELDASLGGNSFWTRRNSSAGTPMLHRLRPDWMTIVAGSPSSATSSRWALDAEVLGYLYHPGGPAGGEDPEVLRPEQVAHYAPYPDPSFAFRGMSWLDPILRDVMGDNAAAEHKLRFFTNGATPNMVVSMDPSIKPDDFERWVKIFRQSSEGVRNAYKTLILGAGATATVVGADMRQIQFADTTAAGEVRICAAARVPPIVAGFIAGLESANYQNFPAARRQFADGTIRPLWRNFCGSMARIIDVPNGAELWYDDRDIPWLAQDVKDAADIQAVEASTIAKLIQEGYEPESVVKAVQNSNWDLLVHTGLISVQLHPGDGSGLEPAAATGEPTSNGAGALPVSAA